MSTSTAPSRTWSRRAKLIVSGLVVLQMLAVLAEPFHFFTHSPARGSSQAARPLRQVMGPYVEFAYLNHGYFFFAPEPGPSHLLQCSLTMPDGTTPTLRYPDKYAQWPRLLYHRHFMFSEFLNQLHVPPVDDAAMRQLPAQEANEWVEGRRRFEMVRQSMEDHLKARYGASAASIARVRHILPGSTEVLEQHLPLNDPRFYIVLPDALPPGETAAGPAGAPQNQSPAGLAAPAGPNGLAPLSPFPAGPPIANPARLGGESVEVKQ